MALKQQKVVIKKGNGIELHIGAISVIGKSSVRVTLKATWIKGHVPEVFSLTDDVKTCNELLQEIVQGQECTRQIGYWHFLSKNSKSAYDNKWVSDGKLGFVTGSLCTTDAHGAYVRQNVRYKGIGQREKQRRNEHEVFRKDDD